MSLGSSWRRFAVIAIVAVTPTTFVVAPALAQDSLAGSYAIEGWDPDEDPAQDSPYRGTGSLESIGGACIYKGAMVGYNYAGVGIYDPETRSLALQFEEIETGRVGVAQYRYSDGRLDGSWKWMDEVDGGLGKEIWTAQ